MGDLKFRRIEADIDLDAIRYNIETVKALNPTDRKTLACYKGGWVRTWRCYSCKRTG